MKIVKKLLALSLCGALLLSISACGGEGKAQTSSKEEAVSAAEQSSQSEGEAEKTKYTEGDSEWFKGRDFSEKQTINLASVQIVDGKNYNNQDEFVKWWADTFNIQWDITSLTFENWAERLRIWINSDDMPDMCVWNYNHGEAKNYADQGLLKALPKDWKENYPNLAKAQSDSPMSEKAESLFGDTHFLFRPIYSNNRPSDKLSPHGSLYLRKDWAEAAGGKVKNVMTLPEVYDLMAKIKAADPGNVGNDFAPIVSRPQNLSNLIQWNSTYCGIANLPFYVGDDGKYQWGGASQDTLEGLKMMSDAYRSGLIAPEFYTIQDPDDYGAFYTTGKSAALIGDGMAWRMTEVDEHMNADLGLKYEDAVQTVTVTDASGNFHSVQQTNYWGASIFSPHISEEKLDRILQMMDYSCTKEGQLLIRCGFKGVDWDMQEDGEIISYLEEGQTFRDKYVANPVYENLMILSDDFQSLDPNFKKTFRE
ncbi:MAG: ABC transporter substrate-binding protein, partial [Oscillospiraceae bacterium]